MTEIKIYKSPWKAIKLILLSLPFIIFCSYSLFFGHSADTTPKMDWFGLCFFGMGIPLGLFNLLDIRPEMIINDDGIFNRQSYGIFNNSKNKGFVKWDSIKDVYLKEYQSRSPQGITTAKQKYICLNLKEDNIIALDGQSNKLNKGLGLGDYNIPLMNLRTFDEQKFIQLIKLMSHSSFSEKQKLLNEFNAQLT